MKSQPNISDSVELHELANKVALEILTGVIGFEEVSERKFQRRFMINRSLSRSLLALLGKRYGLVATEGYGVHVPEFDQTCIRRLVAQRYLIETQSSIELVSSLNRIGDLFESTDKLESMDAKTDEQKFNVLVADAEFHANIALYAGFVEQAGIIRRTFFQMALAAPGYFAGIHVAEIAKEHRLILEEIEHGNCDEVIIAIQEHFIKGLHRWPSVTESYLRYRLFRFGPFRSKPPMLDDRKTVTQG